MRRGIVPALALSGLLVVVGLLVVGPPAGPGSSGTPAGAATPGIVGSGSSPGSGDLLVAPALAPSPSVQDLGEVAAATPFDVAVGMAPENASGLAAYLSAAYLPGTPAYRHFLSAPSLADRFGASAHAIAAATAYFDSYGLRVEASPDRLLLDVQGPADEMGPAFGTSFHQYRTGAGVTFVSHPSPAELPSDLGVTGAFGLGNATPIAPTVAPSQPSVPVAGPAASCAGGTPLVPCQVWGAYDMNGTIASGIDGAGETIGIVDAYDAQETQDDLATDLATFDARFALPTPVVDYLYPVPSNHDLNTTDTAWDVEEALDLQWVHASAPGAAIDMTFSPDPDAGLYVAVDSLVAHQSVDVISLSWGEPDTGIYNSYSAPCQASCNASTDGSYALLGPVLEFAAAEGISVFAASGDCGAADGTNGVTTNFPASNPYVTGVGGTLLSVSSGGTWAGESGWSGNQSGATSPGCANQGGSGGGYSPFPRPWWQVGEGVPADAAHRGVPDVAAVASPGVTLYLRGNELGVGGTSLGTPLWAGIAALADQNAHRSLGLLNPSLYAILRGAEYSTDFHDELSGDNGYSAGPGWDPVTGIGSPIVNALLPDLAAAPAGLPSLKVTLNVSATSGPAPLTVAFSVAAAGGSGQYPVAGVYFGDGSAAFAPAGPLNHTYSVAGVYSAQAYVADSTGNFSVSLPVALVVGGGSALAVRLTPSDATPAAGVSVTWTTTTSGGTSPFSYLYYFGDGTYQNWTANASAAFHAYGTNGSFCAEVMVRDSASPPDGGVSLPVPIAVGSSPIPVCASPPQPLVVTANGTVGVRDAPAEFPSLFTVSGGAGTLSEQYQSTDPYVAACGCEVFRSPGPESVWLYVNESGGPPVVRETNLTIAPELNGSFVASPTFGPAPLTVDFSASVEGGYGANAAGTDWSFGNGQEAVGASAAETYTTPGTYWALGHLSDRGHGNASEAFLIDVGPAGPSAAPYLSATIAPAIDVPSGGTVRYAAAAFAWNGTPTGAAFTWRLGAGVAGYSPEVNRTYFAPAEDAGGFSATGSVAATFLSTGASETVSFALNAFFAEESGGFVPRADAFLLNDSTEPATGPAPLSWIGNASSRGPGTASYLWSFGDGTNASGADAFHRYLVAGKFSVVLVALDSWGDRAVDAAGVDVTNGSAVSLALISSPSVESGWPPLLVNFSADASGGSGGPYTYLWEFGDGAQSTLGNVSHTYDRIGTYLANITVHDAGGASITRSYSIVVSPPPVGGTPILGFIPRSLSLALLATGIGVGTGVILAALFRRGRRTDRASTIL